MPRLSSNTLFHFTSKKEYLINILQNNFMPRYVKEYYPFEAEGLNEIGIPMVCFCDIRLSQVNEHVEWYGSYGIGMRREWAVSKGLTPVQYYNSNAQNIKELASGFSEMRNEFNRIVSSGFKFTEIPPWYFKIYLNVWYMKAYDGKQLHKTKNIEINKNFYDEKEWRFIPSIDSLKNLPSNIPMSLRYNKYNKNEEEKINRMLGKNTKLTFEPEDIAYIIISQESERLEIINSIKHAKRKYKDDEVAILSSKIISLEQIEEDF
jgi:hypothetical protein